MNKKYRLKGTIEEATERKRREEQVLSRIIDALKQVEIEAMVYRLEEGRSLKDPLTYDEINETFKKIAARIERRRAYWNSASGLNAIDGAEPSPEMAEIIEQEVSGEITVEEIKHKFDEIYSSKE